MRWEAREGHKLDHIEFTRPRTVAITREEGGRWIPFEIWETGRECGLVHSIKFEDGSIWDAINGWRPEAKKD